MSETTEKWNEKNEKCIERFMGYYGRKAWHRWNIARHTVMREYHLMRMRYKAARLRRKAARIRRELRRN